MPSVCGAACWWGGGGGGIGQGRCRGAGEEGMRHQVLECMRGCLQGWVKEEGGGISVHW